MDTIILFWCGHEAMVEPELAEVVKDDPWWVVGELCPACEIAAEAAMLRGAAEDA